MGDLTRNFSLLELTQSQEATRRGIHNVPAGQADYDLRLLLAPGLQRVRDVLGKPMIVSSGYRCEFVNRLIGGARNSQHVLGQAADFIAPDFGSPRDVCRAIAAASSSIRFDQLIYEGSWVHISFSGAPRGQVLTATFGGGPTKYSIGVI